MVNDFILAAVKETSKSHADLPDFEERCIEHAEKVEEFMNRIIKALKEFDEGKED